MFDFFKKFTSKPQNIKINNRVSPIQKICPPFNHSNIFTNNSLYNNNEYNFVCVFSTYAASIKGTRDMQQDDYYLSDITKSHNKNRIFAVVCDGMGGMSNGEKASRTAVKTIAKAYDNIRTNESIDCNKFLTEQTILCNELVNNIHDNKNCEGSGTTMTSVLIEDNKLYWCSVGDSRIYIKRGNELYLVTRDHNYYLLLKTMADKGEINLKSAKNHPQREALISYIGMKNIEIMDSNPMPYYLQNDDIILMCSDGVTKTLDKNDIYKSLCNKDAYSIVENIVDNINHKNLNSQDNATLIVIKYSQ